jgi:hypothetical protein
MFPTGFLIPKNVDNDDDKNEPALNQNDNKEGFH